MTNEIRPAQRPASNSTARKRVADAVAVTYSWPLSEAHVAALVQQLEARAEKAEAERDAAREALARVEALVNDEGRSDVAFGARPFAPRGMASRVLHLNDVRRALQPATDEGAGA